MDDRSKAWFNQAWAFGPWVPGPAQAMRQQPVPGGYQPGAFVFGWPQVFADYWPSSSTVNNAQSLAAGQVPGTY